MSGSQAKVLYCVKSMALFQSVFTVTELHAARAASARAPATAESALREMGFTFEDPRAGKVACRGVPAS